MHFTHPKNEKNNFGFSVSPIRISDFEANFRFEICLLRFFNSLKLKTGLKLKNVFGLKIESVSTVFKRALKRFLCACVLGVRRKLVQLDVKVLVSVSN